MVPPIGSKSSLYDNLCKVRQQTGKTPSQLEQFENVKVPEHLNYILCYFHDFYNGDQFSYTELQAWQRFAGIDLNYQEAELIRQLYLERAAFDYKRQTEHAESLKGKK